MNSKKLHEVAEAIAQIPVEPDTTQAAEGDAGCPGSPEVREAEDAHQE